MLPIRHSGRRVFEKGRLPHRLQATDAAALASCRAAEAESKLFQRADAGYGKRLQEHPRRGFVRMGPLGENTVRSVTRPVKISSGVVDRVGKKRPGKLCSDVAQREQIGSQRALL